MINNLELIKPLLTFDNKDDFYYLQIIQRKKENPKLGSNSKVIKNYYVNNLDYLLSKYDEIKQSCKLFNARAMFRLNKRSYRKVALKTIQNVTNSVVNNEYSFVKKSYDRACGQSHNDKVKKWIIDIDYFPVPKELNAITTIIYFCAPSGQKVLTVIPSIQGIHLITLPFNISEFNLHSFPVSIHKDSPTNLYIP